MSYSSPNSGPPPTPLPSCCPSTGQRNFPANSQWQCPGTCTETPILSEAFTILRRARALVTTHAILHRDSVSPKLTGTQVQGKGETDSRQQPDWSQALVLDSDPPKHTESHRLGPYIFWWQHEPSVWGPTTDMGKHLALSSASMGPRGL